MTGREKKEYNDIFFVCSLLEYIGRKTNNHRDVIVNAIGKEKLQHIYEYADVYHCENIDKVSDDLIKDYKIENGSFDNISTCKYSVPTYWDIGKVYKRLIVDVCNNQNKEPVDALFEVYNSWLSLKIENFNSSMYYESPGYIYASYLNGDVL